MHYLITSLRNLPKNLKILIMIIADMSLAFICWLIFGPPLTALLSSNFDIDLIDIIYLNIGNFIFPYLMFFVYLLASDFYKNSTRFSDSRDLTINSLTGSLLFGKLIFKTLIFKFIQQSVVI